MSLNLKWLPSVDLGDMDDLDNAEIMKYNFALEVNDLRTTGQEIGRNAEDKEDIKLVTTTSDIASWFKTRFTSCLSGCGFQFSSEKPVDYTIQFDILDYYVLEESLYRGRLKTKVHLKDNNGNIVWEDLIVGKSSPWGQSFSRENYLNVLSNVIIDNIKELLEKSQLVPSLGKKAGTSKSNGQDI
jgi:hypothetical protein